jgi:hypothetical protein
MKSEFLSSLASLTVVLTPNTSTSTPTGLTLQERVQAVRKSLTPLITDRAQSATTALKTTTSREMIAAWLNWGDWLNGGLWNNFNQWGNF